MGDEAVEEGRLRQDRAGAVEDVGADRVLLGRPGHDPLGLGPQDGRIDHLELPEPQRGRAPEEHEGDDQDDHPPAAVRATRHGVSA